MVSQCANPDCQRELRYLRDGKIYAFAMSTGNGSKSLEHYWLCNEGSKSMTLTCLNQSEVKTARRGQVTSQRGSAAAACGSGVESRTGSFIDTSIDTGP